MIKVAIFDSDAYRQDFAENLQKKGIMISVAPGLSIGRASSYLKAAMDMDMAAEQCVVFTHDEEGCKAARRARMVCFVVGSVDVDRMICAGADCVIASFKEMLPFSDPGEFGSVIDRMLRNFYADTVIGQLLSNAREVMENAYAPFSDFHVGAALLTETGNIYRGCNVENASLGGSICAERGACMQCVAAEGAVKLKLIAIASAADDPAPPCAICRQFLSQFMGEDGQVYLISVKNNVLKHYSFGTLMPYPFTEF